MSSPIPDWKQKQQKTWKPFNIFRMFGLNMKPPFFMFPPLLISLLITPVITEQPETSKVILTGIFVIWWWVS